MRGLIEDNQLVTIAPVDVREVVEGDIVLVRWKSNFLLHLVKEARVDDLLIGNNLGRANGWAKRSAVLGRVTKVHWLLATVAARDGWSFFSYVPRPRSGAADSKSAKRTSRDLDHFTRRASTAWSATDDRPSRTPERPALPLSNHGIFFARKKSL